MHGAQTRIFHQKSLRFTEVKSHVLKAEEGGNIFNVVRAYFPLLYRESLPVFLPQKEHAKRAITRFNLLWNRQNLSCLPEAVWRIQ